jgi:hypothetical protein
MSEGRLNPAGAIAGLSNDLMVRVAKQLGDGFTNYPHVIDQHDAQPAHPSPPASPTSHEPRVRRIRPANVGFSDPRCERPRKPLGSPTDVSSIGTRATAGNAAQPARRTTVVDDNRDAFVMRESGR